ncbi:hypothetical protein LCGC14_0762170 [marine sediment metagenome]|uniref:Uncharacterized protein n=1 Tax=marine sediment metagenome TaxID=412755 RepID=A0A0F9QKN3_9ZZZZ
MSSSLYERAKALGTFAQNIAWFSPSFVPVAPSARSSNLIIQIQSSTSVIVELTTDGTNYFVINSGNAIPIGFSQFEIFATKDDLINLRTSDGAGISVDCRLVNDLDA